MIPADRGVRAKRLASGIFVLTVLLVLAAAVMAIVGGGHATTSDIFTAVGVALVAIVYTGSGALLVARVPRNPIGWIVIWIGFFQMVNALTNTYAGLALNRPGPPLPLGEIASWAAAWTWAPSVGLLVTFLLLLFPDGHLPSPRWRIVAWAAAVAIGLQVVGLAAEFWPLRHELFTDPNVAPSGLVSATATIAVTLSAICSIASVIVRYRRAESEMRQQLRWFTFSAFVVIVGVLLSFFTLDQHFVVFLIGFFLIPITAAIAVMKYRLYDIDVVLSRTLVFGALAGFIGIVYVVVVVVLGQVIGATTSDPALSIAATALVAVLFEPMRVRASRLANRLVYGERATPYEVLSRFSERIAGTYATEDVLSRTARVIAEGTGADQVTVWVRSGNRLRTGARWPEDLAPAAVADLDAGQLPAELEGVVPVPVRYRDELLGALTVAMPRGDDLAPAEAVLLADLADQAGLVLSNVGLTADLEVRLAEISTRSAELRASRQRIVTTQDAERRRLERNIHDGAQQHLVALAVKLRLARGILANDPARAAVMLGELRGEVDDAIETLSSLALGIYPPVLEERGIVLALEEQARLGAVPVSVMSDGVDRQPIETEAAVYFCCLEAMQNASKYARASRVDVHLGHDDGHLTFEVRDDGAGFDTAATSFGSGLQGMADRLSALGGSVEVTSAPGAGTVVRGRVPAVVFA